MFASFCILTSWTQRTSADPEGDRGPDPPPPLGNQKLYWVSVGNKQLDPDPWKKLDAPGKGWTPLEP